MADFAKIADILDRDLSRPVEEAVRVANPDEETVYAELTEYVATDGIRVAYERLFCAIADAARSPDEHAGIWVSGFFGSGTSSFARNLGWVLANRLVRGEPASSLFQRRLESRRVSESIEFLNRSVPYEVFLLDAPPDPAGGEEIARRMYEALLRDLDYAQNGDISELEIELEREGKLAALEELCRKEYGREWRCIREDAQNCARASALVHRLDPRTYASAETWLNMAGARPVRKLSAGELAARSFDLCGIRRPGKAVAFVVDDIGGFLARGGDCVKGLCAAVEQFGRQGLERWKTGRTPGPAWVVVTAHEDPQHADERFAAECPGLRGLQDRFRHRIDLSTAGIGEAAARRVLRKKREGEAILRDLFRQRGADLMKNIRLDGSSLRTDFDEDRFVRFYPYLPHLLDLAIDILAGIRLQPRACDYLDSFNRTIVRQCFEMLVSPGTRLADRPVGALASIDRIYELVEGNIAWEKRKDILEIHRRFDNDDRYPGMAARVAKAICLMELARTDLPCTEANIAALLVQHVAEVPPAEAVAASIAHLKAAQLIRGTEAGWKLHGLDELRRATASLRWLAGAVDGASPQPPGLRNGLRRLRNKLLGRPADWNAAHAREFNASVTRWVEEMAGAIDRLHMSMLALDRQGANMGANYRTVYVIGLFGTGRQYINRLLVENIGERARYFRDFIRLHPDPTPMIYSGHATMKYVSSMQEPPDVMHRILESVRAGFAHTIFIYRHPLDSLLTNWICWRTYIHEKKWISGIAQAYKTTEELCAELEEHFGEFEEFCSGNPKFWVAFPGHRFLTFPEFAEETELHLQAATVALRLEDFIRDPLREFSKIVDLMPVNLDLSRLHVGPPQTKAYRYLAVKEKVPRFRMFIEGLDAETKSRIERIGYTL